MDPGTSYQQVTDTLRLRAPRGASNEIKRMFLNQFLTLAVSQAMEEIHCALTRRVRPDL